MDVFGDLFTKLKTPNLYLFTSLDSKRLQFNGDLIHLTPKCGDQYVSNLFDQSSELLKNVDKFSSTVIASPNPSTSKSDSLMSQLNFRKAVLSDSDLDSSIDMDVTVVPNVDSKPSGVTLDLLYAEIKKTNEVMLKVNSHDVELQAVRKSVSVGFKSTDLAIARIYDDQDFAANVLKENRVTIGSLVLSDSSLPNDRPGWIN